MESPSSRCVYCTPIVIPIDIYYFSCRVLTSLFILERPRVLGIDWHGWKFHIDGTEHPWISCVYFIPVVIIDGLDT
jgi:hypothetical protein